MRKSLQFAFFRLIIDSFFYPMVPVENNNQIR